MVPSLLFKDKLLLCYEYFLYVTPILLSPIMVCHGNHEISYNHNEFIFEDNIFLHLRGRIEQFTPITKCPMCLM